ncbi:MAG: putative transposase [Streptosporangiaceae bacterium]|nr:putative transposase [Streptosporangiaceae bacterium]
MLTLLTGWPSRMRLIVREERPHPGAQLRLTDAGGLRLTCFASNTTGTPIAQLELRHRQRARAEDRIRAARDTGLRNLPIHRTAQNQIWLEIVQLAAGRACMAADARPDRASPPLGTQTTETAAVLRRSPAGDHLHSTSRLDYIVTSFTLPTLTPAWQALNRLADAGMVRRVPARTLLFLIAHGAAAPFTLGPLSDRFDPVDGPLNPVDHIEVVTDIIVSGLRIARPDCADSRSGTRTKRRT